MEATRGYLRREVRRVRVESAEVRFFRSVKGCTRLDKILNQDIRSDFGMYKSAEEIQIKPTNWLKHVERMDDNRLPKLILNCKPTGRRTVGRPRKR